MLTRRQVLNGSLQGLAAISAGALLPLSAARAAADDQVTHTDAEWRKLLTADQYAVLRQEGTERPSPARCCTRSARARSPAPAAT